MAALWHLLYEYRSTIIFIAVLVGAFLLLRTRPSRVDLGELQRITGRGEPVVLEFYSNT
ncbi:MAG: hypothetical protein Kow00124_05690 [Anaerolineae bacterium]